MLVKTIFQQGLGLNMGVASQESLIAKTELQRARQKVPIFSLDADSSRVLLIVEVRM